MEKCHEVSSDGELNKQLNGASHPPHSRLNINRIPEALWPFTAFTAPNRHRGFVSKDLFFFKPKRRQESQSLEGRMANKTIGNHGAYLLNPTCSSLFQTGYSSIYPKSVGRIPTLVITLVLGWANSSLDPCIIRVPLPPDCDFWTVRTKAPVTKGRATQGS